MNTFNMGNLSIPYIISENNKTKYVKLVLDIEGLKVIKPSFANIDDVKKVLQSKSSWIYKHYTGFQTIKSDDEHKRNWESGERILYRGKKYNIRIFNYEEANTLIKFNGKRFEVFVNENISESDRKTLIKNAFEKWYMKSANEAINERLDYYCKIIGLSYSNVKIKEQKTRWGSCSKKGNLNFNWKLIMAPSWVIDYVIIHEICHLKYLNHSKAYWNMVSLYMPNYKKAEEWLKSNGTELTL